MEENQNIFVNNLPKKIKYLNTLLNYDQKKTFLEKAKKFITKEDFTRPHTKSKWCEILGKRKTNPDTRKFLQVLIEEKALKPDGENQDNNKVYRLDRNRLLHIYYNSSFYNRLRDLNLETVNKMEPNKKIVTDI